MKVVSKLRAWLLYRRESRPEKSDVKLYVGAVEIPVRHLWIADGAIHTKSFIRERMRGVPTLDIGDGRLRTSPRERIDYGKGPEFREKEWTFDPGDILTMHVRMDSPWREKR